MPNTPMQISISFVESVTKEEKRGLFGRKKKDDYDSESHEILESTVEGGMVGAAAKAIADAGFVSLTPDAPVVIPDTDDAPSDGSISFGDKIQAEAQKIPEDAPEFPDKKEPVEELSAEDAMKKIFGEMKEAAQSDSAAVAKAEEAAAAESPFVFNIDDASVSVEPKAAEPEKAPAMETVSKTEFTPDATDDSPTKPVTDINSLLFSAGGSGILAQAINDSNKGVAKETKISDLKEEIVVPAVEPAAPVIPVVPVAPAAPVAPVIPEAPVVVPPAPAVVNKPEEIVFAPGEVKVDAGSSDVTASAEDTFDPYGKNSAQELKNTAPLVFGEDVAPKAEPVPSEEVSSIPVPEYEINEAKPELKEEDKLDVDFPEVEKPEVKAPEAPAAPIIEEVIPQAPVVAPSQDDIILPFGEATFATGAEESPKVKADDIPQMPLYDSDNYNNPVNAVGSEQNISEPFNNASVYGDYAGTETPSEVPPYQPYGAEAFSTADQSSYGTYGYGNQTVDMQGGVPMDNNGYPEYGNAGNGYVPGYDQAPQNGFGEYPQGGYQQNPDAGQYYQQDVPQGGYNDYSAQPQQGFGDEYAQPQASASSSSSLDEEWFNNILGVDDSGQVFGGEQTFGYSSAPAEPQPSAIPDPVQQAQYTNPGQTSYRPSGAGPTNNSKPQSSAPRSTAPAAGKSGNGGNGGGKKMKLNRNGYMFIAFLAILVICIIVVISLIAKGCSKGKKPVESSVPSETETSEIITTTTTTQATLPDPSAPIGYFCFSEYIGYRTWWDVFHYVYNIDIKDNSDQRIAKIITYNKLDPSSYSGPNPGDKLLLPPLGVITGEIPMTWNAGGTSTGGDTSATTTTQAEVNSSIHLT